MVSSSWSYLIALVVEDRLLAFILSRPVRRIGAPQFAHFSGFRFASITA